MELWSVGVEKQRMRISECVRCGANAGAFLIREIREIRMANGERGC